MHVETDGSIQMKGSLTIELRDEFGVIKDYLYVPNLVVTAGKNVIADRMKGTPTKGAMSHMAVGTGGTAAAAGDTTLGAEVAASRTALTSTTVTGNQIAYACTFNAGTGTGSLQEAGVFNASSAGDMLCRTTFTTITKGASDSLTINWTVTVS